MAEFLVVGTLPFWILLAIEFAIIIYCLEYEKYIVAPITLGAFLIALWVWGDMPAVGSWIWHNPYQSAGWAVGYFSFGAFVWAIGKWFFFVRDVREKNREEKVKWLANWKNYLFHAKDKVESLTKLLAEMDLQPRMSGDGPVETSPLIRQASNRRYDYGYKIQEEQRAKYTEEKRNAELEVSAWTASNGMMTAELLPFWKEYEKITYVRDWFGRRCLIVKPEPENYKGRIISWIIYWPASMFWTLLNDPIRKLGRQLYYMIAGVLKRISDSVWKDEDNLG